MHVNMKRKSNKRPVGNTKSETLDELVDSVITEKEEEVGVQAILDELQAEANAEYVRKLVYKAIDSERDYQDKKWGHTLSGGRPGHGERSVDEFVTYIVGYTNDLLVNAAHFAKTEDKLHIVRKIAGLCVACMEQHGAPLRDKYPLPFNMKKL
jgi:hypothetical protein